MIAWKLAGSMHVLDPTAAICASGRLVECSISMNRVISVRVILGRVIDSSNDIQFPMCFDQRSDVELQVTSRKRCIEHS
jgi:hypothetical protein